LEIHFGTGIRAPNPTLWSGIECILSLIVFKGQTSILRRKRQDEFIKRLRCSVNVGEVRIWIHRTGIDAGGSKLEAETPNWTKKSSSVELRKTNFVTNLDNNIRASSLIKGGD